MKYFEALMKYTNVFFRVIKHVIRWSFQLAWDAIRYLGIITSFAMDLTSQAFFSLLKIGESMDNYLFPIGMPSSPSYDINSTENHRAPMAKSEFNLH